MSIAWSRVSSVSGFRDGVFGVCVSSGRVFAVGFDEVLGLGLTRYRVEAYSVNKGETLAVWADSEGYSQATLLTCSASSGGLYVAGATGKFWSILLLDKNLNLARRVDYSEPYFLPFSMVSVDDYLYIAGSTVKPSGSRSVLVVKVDARDLKIVESREVSLNNADSGAYSIAYDGKTSQLVVGGFVEIGEGFEWLILFMDRDLESKITLKPGFKGVVTSLTVDYDGYIYVADGSRVVKLSEKGEALVVNNDVPGVKVKAPWSKNTLLESNIAVASSSKLYLLSKDTLKITRSIKYSNSNQLVVNNIGSIDLDNEKLYVALTQVTERNKWNWVIVALNLKEKRKMFKFW